MNINTIYNEDCLDTMYRFADKEVDLLLTDPPYGIGVKYDNYDDSEENWYKLMNKVMPEIIRVSKMAILPSTQIKRMKWFYDNYPPNWLIAWYKGSTGHASYLGFNDWEPHLVYGRNREQLFMHDFFQTMPSPARGTYGHPCPKPEAWAHWLIYRASQINDLIYDPFAGSGTVMLVAKRLNRRYIGSEISAEYCKIANKRINKRQKLFDIEII